MEQKYYDQGWNAFLDGAAFHREAATSDEGWINWRDGWLDCRDAPNEDRVRI